MNSRSGCGVSGVSGSYYSDDFGAVRPVYVHEFCHALLAQALGLSNASEWLHEGLASHYQLRWLKESARELLAQRIATGRLLSLETLANGKPIEVDAYADAALLIDWFLADKERKV